MDHTFGGIELETKIMGIVVKKGWQVLQVFSPYGQFEFEINLNVLFRCEWHVLL